MNGGVKSARVVQGAQLSDSAGTALSEIDSVSRRLAELIEQISQSTLREAELANGEVGIKYLREQGDQQTLKLDQLIQLLASKGE